MGKAIGSIAALSLSMALGSCVAVWGDSHKITHKDGSSVTIEFDPSYTGDDEMQVLANSECGEYGKAVLQSAKRTIAGIDMRNYKCERGSDVQKPAIALLRESLDRFRAKDWAGADDLASKAIARGSLTVNQAAAAHTIRSFCRFAAGRLNDAIADANRAVQLKPDFKAAVALRETLLQVRSAQQATPRQPRPRPADDEIQPPIIQF